MVLGEFGASVLFSANNFQRRTVKRNLLPITAGYVTAYEPTSSDIVFTHSVFAQCFLPLRKLRNNAKSFEVRHGNASIAIDAGRLINPETGELELQDVPYGSAARLALAHIHNHVIRSGSLDEAQTVPMGDSLRSFFRRYRLKVSGQNGKQIIRQVQNIASAHITIGLWQNNQALQLNVPTVAEKIKFWVEKDERQRTFWQPEMILNRRYAETVRERAVPLDMRAMIGLYEKPRAMDLFVWLSYRLPLVKDKRGVFIPYAGPNGLQGVFGNTIAQGNKFRQEFIASLKVVHEWYPEARISFDDKGIRLFPSPSPIPSFGSRAKGGSMFFLD